MNQDLKLRECAQSISCIKLPLYGSILGFLKKNSSRKNMEKSPKFQFFIHPVITKVKQITKKVKQSIL